MCDGKKQKEDAPRTQQGRQQINHQRYLRRTAGKLREEVGGEHEEGGTRRMTNLQLIATGNEFRTIPQAGGGLNGHTIHRSGNGKHQPCQQGVESMESCLLHITLRLLCRKDNNKGLNGLKKVSDICLTLLSESMSVFYLIDCQAVCLAAVGLYLEVRISFYNRL